MGATLFDGSISVPCSESTVSDALKTPGLHWVDIALASASDRSADGVLTALGCDAEDLHRELTDGYGVRFTVKPEGIQGAAWMDDTDATPPMSMVFDWTPARLVTVRVGGDAAIHDVQAQLIERAAILRSDPSRLIGLVLHLLTITVQRGLTILAVKIASLDMQVIASSVPHSGQVAELASMRTFASPIAVRYPLYRINISSALLTVSQVAGLTSDGIAELQQFADVTDDTEQIVQRVVDEMRNAAQDIQGQINTWQGNRINALTVVTIIFLPISFLTGYFGMNFAWLDDQFESFWAWVIFGIALPLVSIAAAILLLARRGFGVRRRSREWATSVPGSRNAPG